MNLGRRWYLVAWDCDRDDWRTFRVDRLARLAPGGERFEPRALPNDDAAAFVAANLSGAPSRYQARVTLFAPVEEVARHSLFTGSTVEAIDERTYELRTSDDSLDWLAVRVGMVGVDFEVHEPPELVERVRELAARLSRLRATGPAAIRRAGPPCPVGQHSPWPAPGQSRLTSYQVDHAPRTPRAPSQAVYTATPPQASSWPGRARAPAQRSARVYPSAATAPAPGSCAAALRRSIAPPWSASALASQRCASGSQAAREPSGNVRASDIPTGHEGLTGEQRD